MQKEKRIHERVSVVMSGVRFKDVDALEPSQMLGDIKNISLGGICVGTNEEIKAGGKLNLSFVFPDGREFSDITGKVIWVKRSDESNLAGINFLKLGLFQRIKLSNSIKRIMTYFNVRSIY
ncbi:MAG: PilZ domain-containing protein [Candidatus Firestonebacteria bacterium]